MEFRIAILTAFAFSFVDHCDPKKCDLKREEGDISFLLDSSTSINDNDFPENLQFINDVTRNLTIGPLDFRVAVALFAFGATLEFNFNEYLNKRSLHAAVNGIQRMWGGTYTHDGLKLARKVFLNNTRLLTSDTSGILILITDGTSSHGELTLREAKLLRDDGVQIFCVGVTNNINAKELEEITGDKGHVFPIDDYEKLTGIVSNVQSSICEVLNPEKSNGASGTTASGSTDQFIPTTLVLVIGVVASSCVVVCCAMIIFLAVTRANEQRKRRRVVC